jgi:hypothetical protein
MRREGSRRAALALTARRPAERDDREPTALGGQSSHAMDLGRKRWPALRHLSLQLARRPTEREEGALGVDKLASDRGEKGMAGRRRDGHQGGLFQGRERSGPASATRDCRPRGPWRGAMGTLRRARRAEGAPRLGGLTVPAESRSPEISAAYRRASIFRDFELSRRRTRFVIGGALQEGNVA